MQILGLDIGGANIKAANIDGQIVSEVFPMWQQHQQLPGALKALANRMNCEPDLIGLTMTAELADCFDSKADGVRFVVDSVVESFPNAGVRVWMTGSEFAEPEDAVELPELVAAANWHAQATWVARSIPEGSAILIDVGSTTTDIIPLHHGWPIPAGLNDRDRLFNGELLYLGASRTPLCALLQKVEIGEQSAPVAAELFATMADAALLCGFTDEQPGVTDTADARPLTKQHSLSRIARMLCCDRTELSEQQIVSIAEQAIQAAADQVLDCLSRCLQRLKLEADNSALAPILVVSGSGADLITSVLGLDGDARFSSVMQLSKMYHTDMSGSACAFAVARLVQDRCRLDLLDESLF
ncbi:MAG: hydantoinase/oxoprolinase family protein [Fuerstiella sp.]